MKMTNIVTLWLENEKEQRGLNNTQALNELNNELHTSHMPHRLSEWKRECRSLPLEVTNYVLPKAVEYATRHDVPAILIRLPVPPRSS